MQVSPSSGQLMAMQNDKTSGKRNAIIKAQREHRLLLEKCADAFPCALWTGMRAPCAILPHAFRSLKLLKCEKKPAVNKIIHLLIQPLIALTCVGFKCLLVCCFALYFMFNVGIIFFFFFYSILQKRISHVVMYAITDENSRRRDICDTPVRMSWDN